MSSPKTKKFTMIFGELSVSYELDQMSRYLDLVQESLHSNYEQLEARYAEMAFFEDSIRFESGYYVDDLSEAVQYFPQQVLLSFIVIWYSFVEQKLLDLCEQLKLRIQIGPKDNKSFDKGIRRAKKFLLSGKGYAIDSDHWRELIEINRLRNLIVHKGKRIGFTSAQPDGRFVKFQADGGPAGFLIIEQELFRYIQAQGILTSSGPIVEVLPSIEYCKSLVDFARTLFRKLYADPS